MRSSFLRKNHGPLEEYAGLRPFSEIETADLRDMLYEFAPHMLVALHSGEEAVLIPYHTIREELPRQFEVLMKIANGLKPKPCSLCRIGRGAEYLYSANGTMTDYAFEAARVPFVYTLEVYVDGALNNEQQLLRPLQCLAKFNPLKDSMLREVLNRWRSWPDSLLNLSDDDQVFFSKLLSNNSALWPLR